MMNERILTDFLVIDTYIAKEKGPAGGIGECKLIRDHSFAACLRKRNLDSQQKLELKAH